MSNLDPGKAERAARRQAKSAQAEMERRRKQEELKIAEEESEIAARKMRSKAGGRSLLIATSRTGQPTLGNTSTLGGI